ncbi:hypothetical protein LP419_10215 [Massilia sp. H-1]|nr:hypothetical protein LP419_10215 [Massilia sp. H-1]
MLPVTAASIKAIDLSSSVFIKSMSMWTDFDKLLKPRFPRWATRSTSWPWTRSS